MCWGYAAGLQMIDTGHVCQPFAFENRIANNSFEHTALQIFASVSLG